MAKKGKTNPLRRWLSNSRLVTLEAILLVGLLDNLIESQVSKLSCPEFIKTLFIMLFIAGAFGVLMSVVVLLTKKSLGGGHKVLRLLPVTTPHLVIHGLVLVGIYWLYANYY